VIVATQEEVVPPTEEKPKTLGDIIVFIVISLIMIIFFMFLIRGCKDFTNNRHHAEKIMEDSNVQIQVVRA
jgi:nucleoside recognition membrane protein YjiH